MCSRSTNKLHDLDSVGGKPSLALLWAITLTAGVSGLLLLKSSKLLEMVLIGEKSVVNQLTSDY